MNGSNFQKYKFSSGFKFREATRREEEESQPTEEHEQHEMEKQRGRDWLKDTLSLINDPQIVVFCAYYRINYQKQEIIDIIIETREANHSPSPSTLVSWLNNFVYVQQE